MEEALRQLPLPNLALIATDAELRALLREKWVLSIMYMAELVPLFERTDSVLGILENSLR